MVQYLGMYWARYPGRCVVRGKAGAERDSREWKACGISAQGGCVAQAAPRWRQGSHPSADARLTSV